MYSAHEPRHEQRGPQLPHRPPEHLRERPTYPTRPPHFGLAKNDTDFRQRGQNIPGTLHHIHTPGSFLRDAHHSFLPNVRDVLPQYHEHRDDVMDRSHQPRSMQPVFQGTLPPPPGNWRPDINAIRRRLPNNRERMMHPSHPPSFGQPGAPYALPTPREHWSQPLQTGYHAPSCTPRMRHVLPPLFHHHF